MIKFSTAGESHGPALVTIVEGVPAGLSIKIDSINFELKRRKLGYGRGGRMDIETDKAVILSGVRHARSLGSPIALMIENLDHKNWSTLMATDEVSKEAERITAARPGHADLAGMMKMGLFDVRDVLERASARETAARVAAGAIFKLILKELGIEVLSHVVSIGRVESKPERLPVPKDLEAIDASPVRSFSPKDEKAMIEEIERAKDAGHSVGGIFEVLAYGAPPGLGGYQSFTERLDARLASAVMSIPAIKGVEFGRGFELAHLPGDEAHDEIFHDKVRGFFRKTNFAGGLEGGMTNGETLILRAAMKPIPTLVKPLKTVDIVSKEEKEALKERSDVCAVAAAAVVAESMVAFEIARAALEKFGGDSLSDLKVNYRSYLKRIGSI
ncbi:MAG: chorismate synthase [Actinomycetota bacterium]|nr:chorismate synthase [Actinomycetota bacterium]